MRRAKKSNVGSFYMGQKRSPQDAELYRRVDEVLYYLWDPIGVSEIPSARNEYYGYLPQAFSLLKSSPNGTDLEKYLLSVAIDRMGIEGSSALLLRTQQVVEILFDYKRHTISP